MKLADIPIITIPSTQTHEEAPPGTTDREMIQNHKYWPHATLPLKRFVPCAPPEGRTRMQIAALHYTGGYDGEYSLCLDHTCWQITKPEDGKSITLEEIMAQGWEVD